MKASVSLLIHLQIKHLNILRISSLIYGYTTLVYLLIKIIFHHENGTQQPSCLLSMDYKERDNRDRDTRDNRDTNDYYHHQQYHCVIMNHIAPPNDIYSPTTT